MLIAYDNEKNRIYANSGKKYKECFCPACGEPLKHRVGNHNIPHFAHLPDSDCFYGKEKDYKCEWHIHMQSLFPLETLEVRFCDRESGELKHIADVFLRESNTVIEFQHSRISDEDFVSRTLFHISEGRRIVWVFDESRPEKELGTLKRCEEAYLSDWIHHNLDFDWPRPRKVLNAIQTPNNIENFNNYSICVDYGEADTVHRIIYHAVDYKEIVLSVHPIVIYGDCCADEFFLPEGYWLSQEPWKTMIAEQVRYNRKKKGNKSTIPPVIRTKAKRRKRL